MLNLWKYPDACEQSIDSLQAAARTWKIIRQKPCLNEIYREWYTKLADLVPPGNQPILEIGSGAGFMQEYISGLIRSDTLPLPGVKKVDACLSLPFADRQLRGIIMANTFHHLRDCETFLREASRCLQTGGAIVMLEPWPTAWSHFVYQKLHSESFDVNALKWQLEGNRPLSDANGALPWIVFVRDKNRFQSLFPQLIIEHIELTMPFRYMLSGGISMRNLVPNFTFPFWKTCEQLLHPLLPYTAMFAYIVVRKVDT